MITNVQPSKKTPCVYLDYSTNTTEKTANIKELKGADIATTHQAKYTPGRVMNRKK